MIVSMVVPCYKGNKYLNQINNMAMRNAQNLPDGYTLELVLVNDSPWEIIDRSLFNEEGYSLKVIINKKNSGIHQSRINGIKAASGEYLLMLDQDDLIADDCFACHIKSIGNADLSVSDGYKRNGDGDRAIYGSLKQHKKIDKILWYLYMENRILSPGQCLIKKNSIPKEWSKYIMQENGADDMLLWIMMLSKKATFKPLYKKLYIHVTTGENVSDDDNKMAKSTFEMLDIIKKTGYCNFFLRTILERKIKNDVFYNEKGYDKYLDYRLIEFFRKIKGKSRK